MEVLDLGGDGVRMIINGKLHRKFHQDPTSGTSMSSKTSGRDLEDRLSLDKVPEDRS